MSESRTRCTVSGLATQRQRRNASNLEVFIFQGRGRRQCGSDAQTPARVRRVSSHPHTGRVLLLSQGDGGN